MQLGTLANSHATWDGQVGCPNQFNPDIRTVIDPTILRQDPLGRTWGDGTLWRAPLQNTLWGWNAAAAARITMPTLVIRGLLDTQAPEAPQLDLFADLGARHKVLVRVACASHYLVWENQHQILLHASEEWLREGTFAGHQSGSFVVGVQ
jgi:pimeloyl-ACP methyl ester carboxylesterase